MYSSELDHIAIAAQSLEQGVAWLETVFGIQIPYGGEHPQMGTHNHIMQLGDGLYVEIICINPDAPAPNRPRWFNLDDPILQQQLAQQPRLLTWIVRNSDIKSCLALLSFDAGSVHQMRRGDLQWQITIPDDGSLPFDGLFPTLIQWPDIPHPSGKMPDLGCRLLSFDLYHPDVAYFQSVLDPLRLTTHIKFHDLTGEETPYFQLQFQTPKGVVDLSSRG